MVRSVVPPCILRVCVCVRSDHIHSLYVILGVLSLQLGNISVLHPFEMVILM